MSSEVPKRRHVWLNRTHKHGVRRKSAKFLALTEIAHRRRVWHNFDQRQERSLKERREIVWLANIIAKLIAFGPDKYRALDQEPSIQHYETALANPQRTGRNRFHAFKIA